MFGLTQQEKKEKKNPPGLGVYAAWLGGLPGFLSGLPSLPSENEPDSFVFMNQTSLRRVISCLLR